jgi:hypothetical protein
MSRRFITLRARRSKSSGLLAATSLAAAQDGDAIGDALAQVLRRSLMVNEGQ